MSRVLSSVQFRPRFATSPADVRDNFRRASKLLVLASRMRADLVVMPELCLTGYAFLSREEAARVAEPADGPTYREFREFAVKSESYVAYGFVEDSGEDLHNSAAVLAPDGEMIILSRKCHPAGNDFLWATPSEEAPSIVGTELGRMSAVVCKDLIDETPDGRDGLFGGKSVDIVAGLTNWGRGFFPASSWIEFAQNNKCTLVLSNRWGTEANVSDAHGQFVCDFHQGGCGIIEPSGKMHIKGLRFNEDCVISASLEVD